MALGVKHLRAVMDFDTQQVTPEQLLRASQLMDDQHIPPRKRFVRFMHNGVPVEMQLDEAIEWVNTTRGD